MDNTNMGLYRGTKDLKAWPMTRGEYNAYRDWPTPSDEDGSEAGYLVEYLDGGKANDDRHSGYISWSPADVFERTYYSTDACATSAGCAPDYDYHDAEMRKFAIGFATRNLSSVFTAKYIVDRAQVIYDFVANKASDCAPDEQSA